VPAETPIGWTDATHNPVGGCEIESPGCIHCYAMNLCGTRLHKHPMYGGTTKLVNGSHVFNGHLTEHPNPDAFQWPLRWKGAKNPRLGPGMRSMIFVADMSDLFHPKRSTDVIYRVVEPCLTSKHICQFLTKRPAVMARYFEESGGPGCPPHPRFWLGFSAEDQVRFDERWPIMRKLAEAGWIVYCSYEPAIGPLKLPDDFLAFADRVWIIIGGESGPRARIYNLKWGENIIQQCQPRGVAVFNKQAGARPHYGPADWSTFVLHPLKFTHKKGEDMAEWPGWTRVREWPKAGIAA